MTTLTLDCAMCSNSEPVVIELKAEDVSTLDAFKRRLKKTGWIVQFNGERIDAYCSKECAK